MGKITRIVYICDICGEESDKELPKCKYCGKDYCSKDKAMLIGVVALERPNAQIKLLDVQEIMCSECSSNTVKWKELLVKQLRPEPKFIVKPL